ncbi:unnamed protein product [Ostreobium quekettii]|uniref:alpha-glucosidase n=1 Tax=Ostreobium quekettii TaxID=121088 RepID=A0A8S1IQB1_9CHLO|nr:unnamed protein product [Ostreobium quekettii]
MRNKGGQAGSEWEQLGTIAFRWPQVTKVRVTALVGNTYHARVHYSRASENGAAGNEVDVDARPSDAINLAVRFDAPVFVNKGVAQRMAHSVRGHEAPELEVIRSCREEMLHIEDPTVMVKLQLQMAVAEERYEDATRLRDQIEQMLSTDRALALVVALESALEGHRYEEAVALRDKLIELRENSAQTSKSMGTPGMILWALAALAALSLAGAGSNERCVSDGPRRDCGWMGINDLACEARGCCWAPVFDSNAPNRPWCFYKSAAVSEYEMASVRETGVGFVGELHQTTSGLPYLGPDIKQLKLSVDYETSSRLHVKISDLEDKRWAVPESLMPRPAASRAATNPLYTFSFEQRPFGFAVARNEDGNVLFDTNGHSLFFKNQYLELTSPVPESSALYGIGERTRSDGIRLQRNGVPTTMWNKDTAAADADTNLYGSHPFLMAIEEGGNAHGIFLLNSNGMDVVLTESTISYRWGYSNVEEVETVVKQYEKADIPLEAMWTDIDYMDGFRDFTLDPNNFGMSQMRTLVKKLHANGQRWVPIIDPGIKVDPGYPAYDDGIREDIFLKDVKGVRYIGKVRTGRTRRAWVLLVLACTPDLGRKGFRGDIACSQNISLNLHLELPPYSINNANRAAPLSEKTIPVSLVHHDGTPEYDAHNLYGFSEAVLTHRALADILTERPFVLTRSSFAGSGKYAAHWSGDNSATWDDLRWSIGSVLNSNLFGMPLVGADICGFNGQTTEELCARWISLGAFYPFSRAHSNRYPQELYLWDGVAAAARKALKMRVRLIPYLYTAFKKAASEGGTVASPLWYEFPQDANTHNNSRQFLLGSGLLVSPVLEEGADHVEAYIPEGTWYNIWDYSVVQGPQALLLPCPLGEIQVHLRAGTVIPMQRAARTTKEAAAGPLDLVVALPPPGAGRAPGLRHGDQHAEGTVYMDEGAAAVDGPDSLTVRFSARVSGQRGHLITAAALRDGASTKSVPSLGTVTVLGAECGYPEHPGKQAGGSLLTGMRARMRAKVNDVEHPSNSVRYDAERRVLELAAVNGDLTRGAVIKWGCEYDFPAV